MAHRHWALAIGSAVAVATVVALTPRAVQSVPVHPERSRGTEAPTRPVVSFTSLPLAFEPSVGQWADELAFVARGRGGSVRLLSDGWSFGRPGGDVRARLVGAAPSSPHGVGLLAARANYFLGN